MVPGAVSAFLRLPPVCAKGVLIGLEDMFHLVPALLLRLFGCLMDPGFCPFANALLDLFKSGFSSATGLMWDREMGVPGG